MKRIDCKALSEKIQNELREAIAELGIVPGLAVIVVGDNPASMTYVNNKRKSSEKVGIRSEVMYLPEDSTTEDVIAAVQHFASRDDIHGVMTQLPMPEHIDASKVIASIPVEKDVDALTPASLGKLLLGETGFIPCTPRGIMNILRHEEVPLAGANCVVIGRSNIVGKPIAALLTQADATVTLCHSKTKGLENITRQADVVIAAVGKPGFITADMVSPDAVVIDVGINRNADGKLVGDVCFDEVLQKAAAVTPVPGGVGVMTVTSLLENTYEAAKQLLNHNKSGGKVRE